MIIYDSENGVYLCKFQSTAVMIHAIYQSVSFIDFRSFCNGRSQLASHSLSSSVICTQLTYFSHGFVERK